MRRPTIGALLICGAILLSAVVGKAETVWFKNAGDRYDYNYMGSWIYTSVMVNFGVWPVAAGHSAGTVYTADGWRTAFWGEASWVANVPNLYGGNDEAWRVRLFGNGGNGNFAGARFVPFAFEFALYVDDQYGARYWGNNGGLNYQIPISSAR
ncbi:MAG: hypothetical protein KJ626_06550 [Verrucomicrobia bacterium]|nr:hypothetical protein [Verrucomicrobiota bacterium]